MQGRRIYPDENGALKMAPGDYGKDGKGVWHVRPPDPEIHTGSIPDHTVIEHEDGTITVSPSILLDPENGEKGWHGHLERGIWRS